MIPIKASILLMVTLVDRTKEFERVNYISEWLHAFGKIDIFAVMLWLVTRKEHVAAEQALVANTWSFIYFHCIFPIADLRKKK